MRVVLQYCAVLSVWRWVEDDVRACVNYSWEYSSANQRVTAGQLDLVFSCFQRALRLAISAEQKADVWYNISFVGINIGDLEFARRCLRVTISMDGGHASALNNLWVDHQLKCRLDILLMINRKKMIFFLLVVTFQRCHRDEARESVESEDVLLISQQVDGRKWRDQA